MNRDKLDVFISYSPSDNEDKWIDAMVDLIAEGFNKLSNQVIEVHFDKEQHLSEAVFPPTSLNAISYCRSVIVFISPAYFTSETCHTEWKAINKNQFVVPIYIKDVNGFPGVAQVDHNTWKEDLSKENIVDLRGWSAIRGPAIGTKALFEVITQICESVRVHFTNDLKKDEDDDELSLSPYSMEAMLNSDVDLVRLKKLLYQPVKSVRIEAIKTLLALSAKTKGTSDYLVVLKDFAQDRLNDTKSRSIAVNCFSKIVVNENAPFLMEILENKSEPTRVRVTAIKALSVYTQSKKATQDLCHRILKDPEEPDSIVNAATKTFIKISNAEDLSKSSVLISHKFPKVRLEGLLFFARYMDKKSGEIIEPLTKDDDPEIQVLASFLHTNLMN